MFIGRLGDISGAPSPQVTAAIIIILYASLSFLVHFEGAQGIIINCSCLLLWIFDTIYTQTGNPPKKLWCVPSHDFLLLLLT